MSEKELTKAQSRKLKCIAKSINALITDIKKTYPNATIYTLDHGGLYVYESSSCDVSLDDTEPLDFAPCRIFGGSV